jgi:hypothetical protein
MSIDPNKTIMHPVEQAHLLYVKGELAEARDLLQFHISTHPSDQEAWQLLHQIERDQVEDVIVDARNNGWLRDMELSIPQLVCLAVVGILMVGSGIWAASIPFSLGIQKGFYTELLMDGTTRGGVPRHFTPSQMLLYPTMWIIGGIILVYIAYRYYQFNRNSNGG